MKRLIEQRYVIRHNLLGIIGICLCVYFSYHMMFGTRSYLNLMSLEHTSERLSEEYASLHAERVMLESRVQKMRPQSLDRDMLEEQARLVLGFTYPGETVIIQSQ